MDLDLFLKDAHTFNQVTEEQRVLHVSQLGMFLRYSGSLANYHKLSQKMQSYFWIVLFFLDHDKHALDYKIE